MKDSILGSEHSIKKAVKTFREKGIEGLTKEESEILLSLMDTEYQNNHSPNGPYPKYEGKGYKGYPTFLDRGTNPEGTEYALVEVAKLSNGKFVDLNEVPKVKINEEYRKLFPDIAESLEKEGQLTPALRYPNGYIVDGEKRKLLLGMDQLEIKEVPNGTEASNLVALTQEQKRVLIEDLEKQFVSNETNLQPSERTDLADRVKLYMKRYGLSRATVYRILNPSVQEEKKEKKAAKLKEHQERILRLKNDLKGLESSYQEVRTNQSRENVCALLMYVEMTIGHIRSL